MFRKYSINSLFICILMLFFSAAAFCNEQVISNTGSYRYVADFNKGVFSNGFTVKDINKLLGKFEAAFEAGNLKKFVKLFEKNVKTDEGNNRQSLRKEYQELFTQTDRRKIKFKNATWKEDKNGVIWGDIDFILNIRSRIDKKIAHFTGTIRMYFKKHNKTLVIDGFFHAYDQETTEKNRRESLGF